MFKIHLFLLLGLSATACVPELEVGCSGPTDCKSGQACVRGQCRSDSDLAVGPTDAAVGGAGGSVATVDVGPRADGAGGRPPAADARFSAGDARVVDAGTANDGRVPELDRGVLPPDATPRGDATAVVADALPTPDVARGDAAPPDAVGWVADAAAVPVDAAPPPVDAGAPLADGPVFVDVGHALVDAAVPSDDASAPCVPGVECQVAGALGECALGHTACDGNSTRCEPDHVSTGEACDALDNDCDGDVDEDFPSLGAPCGAAIACPGGAFVCAADGSSAICSVPDVPSVEVCDGQDNDCDGQIDNGFELGATCAAGVGQCRRSGFVACAPGGESTACDAIAGSPADEICDGLDNDCDGVVDDGFGLGDACQTGVGECLRSGTRVCAAGGGVACSAAAGAPGTEICDGFDNDCDGVVDNDQVCTPDAMVVDAALPPLVDAEVAPDAFVAPVVPVVGVDIVGYSTDVVTTTGSVFLRTTTIAWGADAPGMFDVRVGADCLSGIALVGGAERQGRVEPGVIQTFDVDATELPLGSSTVNVCFAPDVGLPASDSLAVVRDDTAPPTPALLRLAPASPSSERVPVITGQAEAGARVEVYGDAQCARWLGAVTEAGGDRRFTLSIPVALDSRTTFYLRSRDRAGNRSGCTISGLTYEQNDAPRFGPMPASVECRPGHPFSFPVHVVDTPADLASISVTAGPASTCRFRGVRYSPEGVMNVNCASQTAAQSAADCALDIELTDGLATARQGVTVHVRAVDTIVYGQTVATEVTLEQALGGGRFLGTGDLDGDGAFEVFVEIYPGSVDAANPQHVRVMVPDPAWPGHFLGGANVNLGSRDDAATLIQVLSGDIDGDGLSDLVGFGTSTSGGFVQVARQTADGFSVGARQIVENGSRAVADLDGIGGDEIAIVSALNGACVMNFAPLEPSGLSAPVCYAGCGNAGSIFVGEVTGDGRPDLLTGCGNGRGLFVNRQDPLSPGSFLPATVPLGGTLSDIVFKDADGDGELDAVWPQTGLPTLLRVQFGSLDAEQPFSGGETLSPVAANSGAYSGGGGGVVHDLDGDGWLDVVLQDNHGIPVVYSLRDVRHAQASVSPLRYPTNSRLTDVDGDGFADMLNTVRRDAVGFRVATFLEVQLAQRGTPHFTRAVPIATGPSPAALATARLNGNELPSLFVAVEGADRIRLLPALAGTRGAFGAPVDFAGVESPNTLALVAGSVVNNLVLGSSTVAQLSSFAYGDPNHLGAGRVLPAPVGALCSLGNYFFVTAPTADRVARYLRTANPAFGNAVELQLPVGANPTGAAIGSLRGSGSSDLVVALAGSDEVAVIRDADAAALAQPTKFPVAAGPGPVALGRLDGDAFLDVAVGHSSSTDIRLLLADAAGAAGPGGLHAWQTLDAGGAVSAIALTDLDVDGRTDIVAALGEGTEVLVFLQSVAGVFDAPLRLDSGLLPSALAVDDFDGNGRLDIAVAHRGSGDVVIHFQTVEPTP